MTTRRLGQQPALSGLRGVALLAVLYHHLPTNVGPRAYGAVAVCSFFALSGFLITALLLREWDRDGSIRLREFYRRRVVRLLPAVLVMLPIVVVWAALLDIDAVRPALFSGTYVGNWARINDVSLGLFAHTWTLAVEAQFYLLFPFVFIAAMHRWGARGAFAVTLALAAAIATWRAVLWTLAGSVVGWADGGLLIYVTRATDARLDAILFGAAAGFLFVRTRITVGVRAAAVAVIAIAAMGFADPEGDLMIVVGMAAAAVAASVIILHLVTGDSRMKSVLAWAPLTTIGLISYGLYLWHLPVYKLVYLQFDTQPWWLLAVASLSLTFALASISYLVVERRFLGHRRAPDPPVPSAPEPGQAVGAAN